MAFDPNQPYAISSGGGGQWYLQDGQAYDLNGAPITAPVVPATREQATGPFTGLADVPSGYAGAGNKLVRVKSTADGLEFVSPAADAGAVEFTELTDVPQAYTSAGGKFVAVKSDATGLEFVAAPEGAAAFTDLSDAPATIIETALLAGNAAGDGVEFLADMTYVDGVGLDVKESTPGGGTTIVATGGTASASLYADNSPLAQITVATGVLALYLKATGSVIDFDISGGDLKMTGIDVVASDAAARLTVNAVEYSVAKAIKVKIGADTYFWPLFGPVAA